MRQRCKKEVFIENIESLNLLRKKEKHVGILISVYFLYYFEINCACFVSLRKAILVHKAQTPVALLTREHILC